MDVWIAVIVTVLIIVAEHWFPWRKLPSLRGENLPPRLVAFVLGVLALAAPLTGLFLTWGNSRAVCALWSIVVAGGAATVLVYGIDWLLDMVRELCETKERERILSEVDNDIGPHD